MVVLPSLWEGFPNVLLEAMAYQKPVIATRVPGMDEIVIDRETGILVPPADEQALANAILFFINNPEKARDMAVAGRKRAEKMFSIDKTVKETVRLYKDGYKG